MDEEPDVNNKFNTLEDDGVKTYLHFYSNMKTKIWNKLRALISHQTITSTKEEVCEENISLKNSIPTLLKDQNLVTTTPRVERIHGICINCPKKLEIQV